MTNGRFGDFGGQYIPETLMAEVQRVEEAYNFYKNDEAFQAELTTLLNDYAGRPSRLYYAENMTADLGGAKVYLKREDLNHTGSHKINNVLGQALLAKKMGKTRLIAETGAGQHGVATATAAALLKMECEIFMGQEDTDRQALNVFRMELLGAKVNSVAKGTKTLKDAVNETIDGRDVAVVDVNGAIGVNVEAVHMSFHTMQGKLAVVERTHGELGIVLEREVGCLIHLGNLVATIDNAVEDHHLAHRVELHAVGEGIPAGRGDEPLLHQCAQIGLDSLVGGRKDREVTTGSQQLAHRCLAHDADRHTTQQVIIFTIDVMLGQIAGYRLFLEDITSRGVDVLLTTLQHTCCSHQQGKALCVFVGFHSFCNFIIFILVTLGLNFHKVTLFFNNGIKNEEKIRQLLKKVLCRPCFVPFQSYFCIKFPRLSQISHLPDTFAAMMMGKKYSPALVQGRRQAPEEGVIC